LYFLEFIRRRSYSDQLFCQSPAGSHIPDKDGNTKKDQCSQSRDKYEQSCKICNDDRDKPGKSPLVYALRIDRRRRIVGTIRKRDRIAGYE